MTNTLTFTTTIDQYGLLSYSLDGYITEVFESCGEFKQDTFIVGEFAFKANTIEKSAKWYADNYENVIIERIVRHA